MKHPVYFATLLLLLALPASAELPEFYKSVDRLIWVVEDLDQTMSSLRKIGFTDLVEIGDLDIENTEFRSRPATGSVRAAVGGFGDVLSYWFQPLGGDNPYGEFLKQHRGGVFSMMHRTPDLDAFRAEVERMESLGVGTLMKGTVGTDAGPIHFAFFDTREGGKYTLGILNVPGNGQPPLSNPSGRVVTQFAFAVEKLEPVSAYWAKLGFPAMDITHGGLHDRMYRGQPADFDMRLGWQRHGQIAYEWAESIQGPDVYRDHMKVHGEGFQHLAFQVPDMDEDIAWWSARGYKAGMSGGWGEKGKPGSGRFTYIDTHSVTGADIELLWNFR